MFNPGSRENRKVLGECTAVHFLAHYVNALHSWLFTLVQMITRISKYRPLFGRRSNVGLYFSCFWVTYPSVIIDYSKYVLGSSLWSSSFSEKPFLYGLQTTKNDTPICNPTQTITFC